MPHRFHVSVADTLKLDSRLLRHAFVRASKEKMHPDPRVTAESPRLNRTTDVEGGDHPVNCLSSIFAQALTTSDNRPPQPRHPSAYWGRGPAIIPVVFRYPGLPLYQQPGFFAPYLIQGRSFHTTRSYSPQFPGQQDPVARPQGAVETAKMAATSTKRAWESDRRTSYSAERNPVSKRPNCLSAEEYVRQQRSKSCDGIERKRQRPRNSEEELHDEVRRLRRWENTDFGRAHSLKPKVGGLEFTVMTYNVLAQCLLEDNSYLYEHCNPMVLSWDFRKRRILKELAEANADVLCLQEIQSDHYENFFVPELEKLGYAGRYKKRTGSKYDGCAIFFKESVFSLDGCTTVEYSQPGLSLLDRDRDNIALVAMLRRKRDGHLSGGGGAKVCVANTHLLFNPGRGDIKLAQLRILLAEIDRFAYHRLSQNSQKPLYHPVILCGDMNSEPNCALYEFVSTGALCYEGLVAGDISGQKEGFRRGRFCLEKELVPEQLGISDQCQYVDTIHKRTGVKCQQVGTSTEQNWEDLQQNPEKGAAPSARKLDGRLAEYGGSSEYLEEVRTSAQNHQDNLEKTQSDGKRDDHPVTEASASLSGKSDDRPTTDGGPGGDLRRQSESGQSRPNPANSGGRDIDRQCQSVFSTGKMTHRLNFVSAYGHNLGRGASAKGPQAAAAVTTHHRKGSCMVDYIFYTVHSKNSSVRKRNGGQQVEHRDTKDGALSLLATYGLLSCAEVTALGGLPNSAMPSDHLTLMARFLLRDDS